MDSPTEPAQNITTTIGGEKYRGREDYLRSIMVVYSRIANLSGSNEKRKALLWDLEYSTKILINSIISPDDRDTMRRAYSTILQIEYLKRVEDPSKYKNIGEIKAALKDDDLIEAGIEACMIIIGETRTYYDRYFGFETKLEVMRGAVSA